MKYLILLMIVTFASCRSEHPLVTNTDRTVTHTEINRTVDVTTEGDTATAVYRIVIPSDTDTINRSGKPQSVILEKVGESKGKYLNAPKISIKDGQLIVTAVARPQTIPVEVKDTYVNERETTTKTKIIVKNELTAWQTVRVWLGNIVIGLLAALVVVQILRVKKVLKF